MTRTVEELQAHFTDVPADLAAEGRLRAFSAGLAAAPAANHADSPTDQLIRLEADSAGGKSLRTTRRNGWLLPAIAASVLIAAVGTTVAAERPGHKSATNKPVAAAALQSPSSPTALVPADPTPAAAPFSLALVPAGWKLLTWQSDHVSYTGPSRPSTDHYDGLMGNLDVILERRSDPSPGVPIQVTGGPVVVPGTSPGDGQFIAIPAGTSRVIVVQVPPSLALTADQLQQLAHGITMRANARPSGNG